MQHSSDSTSILSPNMYPKLVLNQLTLLQIIEIQTLTKRLILQSWRRPAMLITGILQPLLWLILFSALFQNAPIDLFTSSSRYSNFISPGIIVFTAFTCSLNAGLPLMFDREFGFLNRLLSSPLYSRYSIIYSSSLYINITSFIQVLCLIAINSMMGSSIPNFHNGLIITIALLLISNSFTNISLLLAFIMPGHIELLACLVMINLPLLFASTALAPLVFMPSWLQTLASLNPLSYTIEIIRYAYLHEFCYNSSIVIDTVWGSVSIINTYIIMIIINFLSIVITYNAICNKFEE